MRKRRTIHEAPEMWVLGRNARPLVLVPGIAWLPYTAILAADLHPLGCLIGTPNLPHGHALANTTFFSLLPG